MGAVFDILHPSFKSALQRADEYLPADKCLKARRRWRGRGWKGTALEPRWKLELLEEKTSALLNWTGSRLTSADKAEARVRAHRSQNRKSGPCPTIKDLPSQWHLTHSWHIKCIYPPLRAHEYQCHYNYIYYALLQMKKWLHFWTKLNFSRHNICQGNQIRFHLAN